VRRWPTDWSVEWLREARAQVTSGRPASLTGPNVATQNAGLDQPDSCEDRVEAHSPTSQGGAARPARAGVMAGCAADPAQAVQEVVRAGEAFARAIAGLIASQQAAIAPALAQTPPAAGDSEAAQLQRDLAARHLALWAAMVQRNGGDAASALAPVTDRRFSAPEWSDGSHFDYLRRAYLLNAEYLRRLAELAPVADERARRRLRFVVRQIADAMAPSNFAAGNPEILRTVIETGGASLTAGIRNLIADLARGRLSMTDESAFEVGRNLAITPGAVVFENALMQLIQYAPLTQKVAKRPLLIVPPCINKYYVLDLQPENSLVRFLVEQGHTVFVISWRNVAAELGRLGWDDYLELGPLAAIRVVREIARADDLNLFGFCIGGTLAASAAAVAAARDEKSVASLTLLTTLLDFSEAGELGCFVDEAAVSAREAAIGAGGLLRGTELAAVFSSLRANDLVWPNVIGNYLKGATPPAFDILYWNADSTNLPGPFLTWYLRNAYLENRLAAPGAVRLCGQACDLGRLDMPAYLYASREDHIVPWAGAYRSRQVLRGETTFVLGASGHIAGVINPPAKNRRSYWTNDAPAATAGEWLDAATEHRGSWWAHWAAWLDGHRGGRRRAPRGLGNARHRPIEAAPGRYVKERV